MKLRVPNEMMNQILENADTNEKDKKRLKLYLSKWSSEKGYSIVDSDEFEITLFNKLQEMLDKIDKKDSKHHYLKRQLKLLYNILDNPSGAVPTSLENLESVLQVYMKNTKDSIIFSKQEENFYPYLVTSIQYVPSSPYSSASVDINVKFIEFDETKEEKIKIYKRDIIGGKTTKQILDDLQLYLSNESLIKDYEEELEVYKKYKEMVGKQFLGGGRGIIQSTWGNDTIIPLEIDGIKSKLIVDIYQNEDYKGRIKYNNPEKLEVLHKMDGRDYRIPIHPNLFCFNLNSHEYIKVHASNLEVYKYNPNLINKLVLPQEDKSLIDILIDGTKDIMEDIVKGKTGGIIVITTGVPGTGKTLTAEVYSEVVKKPLYVVQSSQLGVEIKELENNLKKILDRASRWNAILLIDEADVYVHERGDDLVQNAVVGVFLRVLEYYKGILFMTSNRETVIDDAILSRATAHIRYEFPNEELSKKIWKVLSKQFKIELSEEEINKIYKNFGDIPGRDIKSLVKLARLLAKRENKNVDCELLKYVSKFLDIREGKRKSK